MKNIIVVLIMVILSSCITRIEKQGYMFELVDKLSIESNITSKDRVLDIMGSPTFKSNIGKGESWIYYSQDVRKLLFFKPKVVKREIMILEFGIDNVVSNIREYDLLDKNDKIAFVSKYSAVGEHKTGFFSELFGNIGQVRAQ